MIGCLTETTTCVVAKPLVVYDNELTNRLTVSCYSRGRTILYSVYLYFSIDCDLSCVATQIGDTSLNVWKYDENKCLKWLQVP